MIDRRSDPGTPAMARAKETPLYRQTTDCEDDVHQWSYERAELQRRRRFGKVDLPNVVEELESTGSEIRHALVSSYRLLIAHLLKWQFQPDKRTRSRAMTITRERANIAQREERNWSLKAEADAIVADVYRRAVREASVETGLPKSVFPADRPFSTAQLRDDDFLPE